MSLYRALFVASAAGLSAGYDSAIQPPEIGEVRGTTFPDSATRIHLSDSLCTLGELARKQESYDSALSLHHPARREKSAMPPRLYRLPCVLNRYDVSYHYSPRSFQRQQEESRHGKKVLAFGYCGSEQEGGLPWTCQELAMVLGLAALLIVIAPLKQGLSVLILK